MSDRAPTPHALKKAFSDSEKEFERIKHEGEARASEATRVAKKGAQKTIDSIENGLEKIRPASTSNSHSPRSTLV
jgi:vacuolar-type H+-ATPase subunit E/Vma4